MTRLTKILFVLTGLIGIILIVRLWSGADRSIQVFCRDMRRGGRRSQLEFVLNRHNHIYLRDRGSSHSLELHRDVRHWSRTIVTVLVYLEDTNLENGCTRVVPGSHLLPGLANLREDDNLRRIAARFGTTQAVLIRINKLSNPNDIKVGQKLKIPTG